SGARRARFRRIADAVRSRRADRSGDRRSRSLSCGTEPRSDAMRMLAHFNTAVVAAGLAASFPLSAQVSFERILNADREPHNWLSYSRTLTNQRYSPLDQIGVDNVQELELAWIWQARSLEKFEATALAVDGILYTVQAPNDVVALDAVTGRVFWTYHHEPSPDARLCCGRVNRGLAILDDTLYMG